MAERTEFLRFLAGLLAIMNGAVVQSQPVRNCYNDTGNPVCYTADKGRDQRLKTWTAAKDYCRFLRNASLPTVKSPQDQFHLIEFLRENDFLLDSVWLGGQGFSNGFNWTWMNGSVFSGSLNTLSLDKSFATVSWKDDGNATLDELGLDAEADGYICQYKGETVCNGSGSDTTYTEGDSCFASFGESINWFLARNKCLLRRAELATLTDTTEAGLKKILDRLHYKPPQQKEEKKGYWIGLRKIWWRWVDDNTDVGEAYFKHDLSLDVLNSAEQNCLTVDYKHQFAWSIRNCSIPFQTICQDGTAMVTMTTQPSSEATTPTVTLPVWAVGLISGLAGLVYIVSLIVVGVVCCKCCRKPSQKNPESENEKSNQRRNSYVEERRVGPQEPKASNGGDFNGEYPEDEFDDYDDIVEPEKKTDGEYVNHLQVSNTRRTIFPH